MLLREGGIILKHGQVNRMTTKLVTHCPNFCTIPK
ncbi:hypothetical protein TNCV_4527561 [Trichonephila clavipes]|nr:hypothetical protein TNCV_4527561 [Trichonephila clavipes]